MVLGSEELWRVLKSRDGVFFIVVVVVVVVVNEEEGLV